jgi:hypothetical protein
MLALVDCLCCISFTNPIGVGAGVRRQRLLCPTEQVLPENGDGVQSPKRRILNTRQDDE